MNWKKLGQIYHCKSSCQDLITHAANPLAVHISGSIYRIFFSGRNAENKSSVGYVDIDIFSLKVLDEEESFVIRYGGPDTFFSHGISIGNCYEVQKFSYILFMGWQIPEGEHWKGEIGRLKLSEDKKSLTLNPENSFFSTDSEDPVSLSYPWVMHDENMYKMWYGSTISWSSENGEMIHVIKYATSKDAIHWEKHGVAVPYVLGEYQAFSRPCVIKDSEGYHMWYSYRGAPPMKYRIGYSFSKNGISWEVKHEDVGISISDFGWDSEMICYPYVFDYKDRRYMLYNGNEYGKYGFGLAILEQK